MLLFLGRGIAQGLKDIFLLEKMECIGFNRAVCAESKQVGFEGI